MMFFLQSMLVLRGGWEQDWSIGLPTVVKKNSPFSELRSLGARSPHSFIFTDYHSAGLLSLSLYRNTTGWDRKSVFFQVIHPINDPLFLETQYKITETKPVGWENANDKISQPMILNSSQGLAILHNTHHTNYGKR